ncbi:MAG: hypothetical protein HY924_16850 [Elusimicrobia bacterium]|nr:hypothetical protein [Elusimicrobiota bacterium]
MTIRLAALAVLLSVLPRPASAAASGPERLGSRTQLDAGALLVLSGSGQDWASVVTDVRKALEGRFLVEQAPASDAKAIQAAVDKLQARRVKKIVAVPMLLSSHSAEMDENRYIFGVREHPAAAFLGSHAHSGYSVVRRIKARVPVVLTAALDDHSVFAELLTERALDLSKDPSRESLVLAVPSLAVDLANSQWSGTIQSLAEKVRRATGFRQVQTVFLTEDASQVDRDKAEQALRSTVRGLAEGKGRVIVIPVSLTRGSERRLRKLFEGLFVRFDGKAALPNPKIIRWVEEALTKGVKLPDMRAYTKEEAPPSAPRLDRLTRPLLAPPAKAAKAGAAQPKSDSEAP